MSDNRKKAFTLVELLVVIAIIGLLSSVVYASLSASRGRARDAVRKSDLKQIALAMELYDDKYQTYILPDCGYAGSGSGWFNYDEGNYSVSIAQRLINEGMFGVAPRDPLLSSNIGTPQYMLYYCGSGYYVYARLEHPKTEDIAAYTASKNQGCANLDVYQMNYAVGHK